MVASLDAPTTAPAATTTLPRLRESFLQHFRGHFDNYEQVCANEAVGLAPRQGGGHEHIHCLLREVPTAGLSAESSSRVHILASYYFNGQPEMVFRERLYEVEETMDEQFGECVRMSIYRLRDSMNERLAEDVDSELRISGADVFWRQCGERFEGHMRTSAITIVSERTGRDMIVRDDVLLSADALWVNDRGYDKETGEYMYGNIYGVPYKMRRVPDTHWTATGGPAPNS